MDFDWLTHCLPCKAWCCKSENPYASSDELIKLNVSRIFQKSDGLCAFLTDDKCVNYSNRPFECRIFPFDIQEISDNLMWVLWNVCPAKEFLNYEEVMSYFEKSLNSKQSIDYVKSYVEYHKLNQPAKYDNIDFDVLRKVASPIIEDFLSYFERDFPSRWPLNYVKAYVNHHKIHQPVKYSSFSFAVLREVKWA